MLYFFFASCSDVCPISNQILKGVQDKLITKKVFGKDVELFSVTIDPIRDTQEVLKEYADLFGADDSGWHFLRSETPQEVRTVSEGFNTGVLNEDGNMIHADIIILIDKKNQIREYYIDKDIDAIVKDVLSLI